VRERRSEVAERRDASLGHLHEQGVLVAEVAVQGPLGASRALGDGPGRGVSHADLGHDLLRRAQDLLAHVGLCGRRRLDRHHAAPANSSPCSPTWLRTKIADTSPARSMKATATYRAVCMAWTNGWAMES